jgi:hypothetical protein
MSVAEKSVDDAVWVFGMRCFGFTPLPFGFAHLDPVGNIVIARTTFAVPIVGICNNIASRCRVSMARLGEADECAAALGHPIAIRGTDICADTQICQTEVRTRSVQRGMARVADAQASLLSSVLVKPAKHGESLVSPWSHTGGLSLA